MVANELCIGLPVRWRGAMGTVAVVPFTASQRVGIVFGYSYKEMVKPGQEWSDDVV